MKITFPRLLCAIILFCLSAAEVKAQSNPYFIPTVFAKTPNSTAFAKYGDYPVNLYSGLPDITIPLYTIEAGGLQVPISISYHASGLKVNEVASVVGAGWSLNAGGGITRQVVGTTDEGTSGYFSGYRSDTSLHPIPSNADLLYLYQTVTISAHDNRPDIFSYDVPGHSGKFFFDATSATIPYAVRLIPFAPMQVTNTAVNFGTDTPRFALVDEHGTSYKIGYTYKENTSTAFLSGAHTQAITAWKLENMISQNGRDTINFTYYSQGFSPPDQVGQIETVEDQQNMTGLPGSGCPTSYINPQNPVVAPSNSSSGMNEQEIQQITFRNGKVTFATNTTRSDFVGKKLDSMKVYTYNFGLKKYELQKCIIFYQHYYTGVGGAQGRLRLDSLQILDKAGSIIQHYRFDYNNLPVPPYMSYSRDFWGYYNGVTNTTLIPQMTIDYNSPNASSPNSPIIIGAINANSRNTDSVMMQAGILKTIHYPTGGYTTFAYQANRYLDSSGVMRLTGGLRIDTISSYDGISSTPIVKTYQYNKTRPNFMTTGNGLLNYGFYIHQLLGRTFFMSLTGGQYDLCGTKRIRTYYSESLSNLTGSEGNPVAYTNVTEYIGTPGTNTGKSVYTFRDYSDSWAGSTPSTGIPVILDHFYARGQMLSKSDYLRKSDGTYQIVKRVSNTYSAYPETSYVDVGMVVGQMRQTDGSTAIIYPHTAGTIPDDATGTFPFTSYSIVSDDNYQTGSTTQIYDTNDTTKYTTSAVSYNYGSVNYQQIASVTHVDSKGNTHITSTRYPFDYQTYATHNTVIDNMLSRHMYAEPIEKWDSLRNVTTSVNTVTGAQLNQYKVGNISTAIVPSTISTLSVSSPAAFTHSSIVSGNLVADSRYVQMISFDRFDGQNNIAQYTPRNSTPVSILWDYQYELPVAQVKNATNVFPASEVAYTSFEANVNGGWTFSGAPVKDVTAPTGIFVYPLNAGSVTLSTYDNTKSYVLLLWSNGSAPTVNSGTALTGTALKTTNGWTYYEYTVPVAATTITISGTMSIDELRFYPVAAQMTTYAYDPSGIRSIMDAKSEPGYFEYDFFQRLKNIRDYNGNIVNNYGYHTYDQTISNDAIGATMFTRDNCPTNTTPQSTTYAVPAAKYYSSTKASANAEAQYDLQTYGQAKADNPAICGCPVTTFNFTFTNSSGISGWTAVFTIGGVPTTYSFPVAGHAPTTVPIPVGTYTTVYIGPIGTFTPTFTLGSRTPITGQHSATFNSVVIATSGSTDTSLTVQ